MKTLLLVTVAVPVAIAKQSDAPQRDTVVIYGRQLDLIGEASSASEGIVGYADF